MSRGTRGLLLLSVLLIGAAALSPSVVPAQDRAGPGTEAQSLLKELARTQTIQDVAVKEFQTGIKARLQATDEQLRSVDRDIDAHNKQGAQIKKKYGTACNANYSDRAQYQHWKKFCADLSAAQNRKGKAINDKKKRLLTVRRSLIEKRDKLKAQYEAAQKRSRAVADRLGALELPGACRSCRQIKDGKKGIACYLRCWNPPTGS